MDGVVKRGNISFTWRLEKKRELDIDLAKRSDTVDESSLSIGRFKADPQKRKSEGMGFHAMFNSLGHITMR